MWHRAEQFDQKSLYWWPLNRTVTTQHCERMWSELVAWLANQPISDEVSRREPCLPLTDLLLELLNIVPGPKYPGIRLNWNNYWISRDIVNFWNLYSGSESNYRFRHSFPFRCVNPVALSLVRCYSICLPRRVALWVNYSSWRTESSSEHVASDLSLLKADALWWENKRCSDSNPW